MPTFAGRFLLSDHEQPGWLQTDGATVTAVGRDDDPPEPPVATGWICPPPVNAHTHVADAFLRDAHDKPADVAALVGPGGFKHRHLATATAEQMLAGIERYTDEMAAIGTSHCIDFREGGLEGARLLRDAAGRLDVHPVVYGRPTHNQFDEEEALDLLAVVDGIGLSGVRDFPRRRDIEAWADACHDEGKPWAIHLSEDKRDDAEWIASLQPRFVVHCTKATPADFRVLADHDVPIVACPRSNQHFGMKTPLEAMLEAGCRVAIGTDNGMLQDGDALAELGQLKAWFPAVGDADLLRMLTANGRALLGLPPPRVPAVGDRLDHVVFPAGAIPFVDAGKPGWTAPPAPPAETAKADDAAE